MSEEAVLATEEYTRDRPSPRYLQLLEQYRHMHLHGNHNTKPQDMFAGISLPAQAPRIAALVRHTGASTLLDYGCGKGILYKASKITLGDKTYPSIQAFWGVSEVTFYDPAYPPYTALPQGKFDGVISTDVLEHCPEQDIPWILGEIFSYASRFVFANIACYPAKKTLPNGENAHCTVRPAEWWRAAIEVQAARFPGLQYQFIVTEAVQAGGEMKKVEKTIERIHRR